MRLNSGNSYGANVSEKNLSGNRPMKLVATLSFSRTLSSKEERSTRKRTMATTMAGRMAQNVLFNSESAFLSVDIVSTSPNSRKNNTILVSTNKIFKYIGVKLYFPIFSPIIYSAIIPLPTLTRNKPLFAKIYSFSPSTMYVAKNSL